MTGVSDKADLTYEICGKGLMEVKCLHESQFAKDGTDRRLFDANYK